jgi:hypothetical protein
MDTRKGKLWNRLDSYPEVAGTVVPATSESFQISRKVMIRRVGLSSWAPRLSFD